MVNVRVFNEAPVGKQARGSGATPRGYVTGSFVMTERLHATLAGKHIVKLIWCQLGFEPQISQAGGECHTVRPKGSSRPKCLGTSTADSGCYSFHVSFLWVRGEVALLPHFLFSFYVYVKVCAQCVRKQTSNNAGKGLYTITRLCSFFWGERVFIKDHL